MQAISQVSLQLSPRVGSVFRPTHRFPCRPVATTLVSGSGGKLKPAEIPTRSNQGQDPKPQTSEVSPGVFCVKACFGDPSQGVSTASKHFNRSRIAGHGRGFAGVLFLNRSWSHQKEVARSLQPCCKMDDLTFSGCDTHTHTHTTYILYVYIYIHMLCSPPPPKIHLWVVLSIFWCPKSFLGVNYIYIYICT